MVYSLCVAQTECYEIDSTQIQLDYEMVAEGQYCGADYEVLSFNAADAEGCAVLCSQTTGCQFLFYAPDYGSCYWSQTTDISCPEGFDNLSWFDFWVVNGF